MNQTNPFRPIQPHPGAGAAVHHTMEYADENDRPMALLGKRVAPDDNNDDLCSSVASKRPWVSRGIGSNQRLTSLSSMLPTSTTSEALW